MSDSELMEKYRLSAKGLQSAFDKLVEKGIMTVEQIYGQTRSGDDTVLVDDMRLIPKHFLTVAVPIYEPASVPVEGLLTEITERGLGVTGIPARVGEVKTFVIPAAKFIKTETIWFEARCLWARPIEGDEPWAAQFQITRISQECLAQLRELIQVLALGF